jgi:hypothetical protein
MNFDEPVGQNPEHRDLATWSSTDESGTSDSDTEEPKGFIVYRRVNIKKKRYKDILQEEELID